MKRIIFCLGICVLLFTSAICGQQPKPDVTAADTCEKKKQTLAQLEAEAPTLRTDIATKETFVKKLDGMTAPGANPPPNMLEYIMAVTVYNLERDKLALEMAKTEEKRIEERNRLVEDRYWMDFWTEFVSYRKINGNNVGFKSSVQKKAESDLTALKERQTYVANQIFLIREQIPAGGCDSVKADPGERTATVGGPGVWVSTGITLRKGQRFKITATGSIKAREYPFTEIGPGGNGYYSLKGLIKDPSGANDQFMTIGASGADTARFDGELMLAVTRSNYYNNGKAAHGEDALYQGSIQVKITVDP